MAGNLGRVTEMDNATLLSSLVTAWERAFTQNSERSRNDSAGKHGVIGDHPETTGASEGALETVFITKRPRLSGPEAVKISKIRYSVKLSTVPLK